jgi:hypothetical protein
MPPKNYALIARAFTAEDAQADISDVTLNAGSDYAVRVEVEAGDTLFGLSVPYELVIYVRELAPGHAIVSDSNSGSLGAGDWATAASVITFTVNAADIDVGHVYEVLAVLTIGGAGSEFAIFTRSALFIGV